ncbi:diacylglycerol kinase [Vibrio salinus]|uniref:diacylglycerol kinase n=1 Tax=Vibrio salinus TaxID=2899784 RepID=UPI003563F431
MQKKNPQGITRIIKAARYSYQGLKSAIVNEAAFREELLLCLVFIPLATYLNVTTVERILMIGVLLFVLVVELLNSAVEAVVDRIGLEHHELAGQAKDMGSAAVFIAMGLAIFVWISIIWF